MFVLFYVATFAAIGWLSLLPGQWNGLASVVVATSLCLALLERHAWPLGLFVPPRLAFREGLGGMLFGTVLVGACAVVVALSTELRHAFRGGFPWLEVLVVFVPAVFHEELLFRGYAFQKLLRWRRGFAIVFVALVFAWLHGGNTNVTPLGLVNIFLGGVLLGYAYERYQRLWFPIGLHLAWNLMAGPISGHEVSGYRAAESLLITVNDVGPPWLTGGDFGIEGSALMTLVELAGIAVLAKTNMIRAADVESSGEKESQ